MNATRCNAASLALFEKGLYRFGLEMFLTRGNATLKGVFLGDDFDLEAFYGPALAAAGGPDVLIRKPENISDTTEIRFAVCWGPAAEAFDPYPGIEFAMVVGAGVDALIAHPGLKPDVKICRVRDPDQADQMAGFALHEILEVERQFPEMARNAGNGIWAPMDLRSPSEVEVAVLGGGSMGGAVARAVRALGFPVRIASRSEPSNSIPGIRYFAGQGAIDKACEGADFCVNVLPLTPQTENILNRDLFFKMARGSWLVQIGRGEHLVEADLLAALDEGQLAGATLDVFRKEPLNADHPFWSHPKLRITPHIASCATPKIVAQQIVQTIRELGEGRDLTLAIDRARGY